MIDLVNLPLSVRPAEQKTDDFGKLSPPLKM